MLKKVLVLFLLLGAISFAQHIKVEDGTFKVVNYTLIEEPLNYRVYDYNTKKCIRGGEMDGADFYERTFFTDRKGKFEIVIYKKPNMIYIKEIVEVK